jgi:hypothetical protein
VHFLRSEARHQNYSRGATKHRSEENDLDFIRDVQILSQVAGRFIPKAGRLWFLASRLNSNGAVVLIEEAINIAAENLQSEC